MCKPEPTIGDDKTYVRKASGIVESPSFRDKWLAMLLDMQKKCIKKQWKESIVTACMAKARTFMDKRLQHDLPLTEKHLQIFRKLSMRSSTIALARGHALQSYVNTLSSTESFKAMLMALDSDRSFPSSPDEALQSFVEDELVTPTLVDDRNSWFERRNKRRQLFRLPRGQLVAKLDDCEKMVVIPHFISWDAVKSLPDNIVDCFTEDKSLFVNTGTRALKYSWKRGKFRPLSESEEWTSYSSGYLYSLNLSSRLITISEEANRENTRIFRVRDPLSMLSNPKESFGEVTGFTVREGRITILCVSGKAMITLCDVFSNENLSIADAFDFDSENITAQIKDYDESGSFVNLVSRHRSGFFYREQRVDANNIMRLDSRSFLVGQSIAHLKRTD